MNSFWLLDTDTFSFYDRGHQPTVSRVVATPTKLWGEAPNIHLRGEGAEKNIFVREGGLWASAPHSVELQFHA